MSNPQKTLLSLCRRQFKLFDRTARGILREFGKESSGERFIPQIHELQALIAAQTEAAQVIFDAMLEFDCSEVNRSCAFVRSPDNKIYEYLSNKRKAAELIGDLDEWKTALSTSAELTKEAREGSDSDKEAANEIAWRLVACQDQIQSLVRQAEALTATQDALMRAFGLKYWQGHKRYLRWEGDREVPFAYHP